MSIETRTVPFKPPTEFDLLTQQWIQPPMDSKTVTLFVPDHKKTDPNKIGSK